MSLKILAVNFAADTSNITLTDTPTASASFPATNLTDSRREYFGQFGSTSVTLSYALATSKKVNCVFVASHNLDATDTIQIKIWDDAGKTNLVHNGSATAVVDATPWAGYTAADNPQSISYGEQYGTATYDYHISTAVDCKVIDIIISSSNNPTQIGYVSFGHSWTFSDTTAGISWATQLREIDTTQNLRSAAGSFISVAGYTYRELTMPLDWLDEQDRISLVGHLRYIGKDQPVCVSVFSGESNLIKSDFAFVGRMVSDIITRQTHSNNWASSITFQES